MTTTTTRPPAGHDLVTIPAGGFWRGSDEFDLEGPRAWIDLPVYRIDRYPVTIAQYGRFLADTGREAPPGWSDQVSQAEHPVAGVSHDDATAYAAWAGLRLPTEAEWEKAARGTDGRRWPWGEEFEESRALVWDFAKAAENFTAAVTDFEHGVSPYGVHQLVGNVEEWVADELRPYPGGPAVTAYTDGRCRVLRGGSWFFTNEYTRCSFRRGAQPSFTGYAGSGGPGFRCAQSEEA